MAIEDNGPTIVGATWFLCWFSAAFLGLRIYAKLSRHHNLWWDDYILIASWVLLLAESITTQVGQLMGFGKHTADIPVENLPTIGLGVSIVASISCFASTGSKISFGVTLLRLTDGHWRRFVWFAIITLFIVMLPSALLTWISCKPVQKAWNSNIEGKCWDSVYTVGYGIFNAAWCTVIDFALALLPWHIIWKLQMRMREKIGVALAMSLGLLAGMCAIIKGIYLIQIRQDDFYYNGKDVVIWTATETAAAIVAASIPVLRVFFKEAVSSRNYNTHSKQDTRASRFYDRSMGLGNGTQVSTLGRHKSEPWIKLESRKGDLERSNGSNDDLIDPTTGKSGILQTSTVVVDYNDGPHLANKML